MYTDDSNTIILPHPEFGEVVFSKMTPRQIDILKKIKELITEGKLKDYGVVKKT